MTRRVPPLHVLAHPLARALVRIPCRANMFVSSVLTWCVLVVLSLTPSLARAQVAANETWYVLHTKHFRIYYTAGLEAQGRRAAADAEHAYANLSSELVPPRGIIDVVVTDAIDASNGSTSVFPRNHVVIQIRPPVDQTSLDSYDDWTFVVLQHELTHVFHLDRTRGWWRLGQDLFGRNPLLFPNVYSPAWITEGLAVYYESRFSPGGRLESAYQYDVAHAAARAHKIPSLSELSLASTRYPYGQLSYIYGSFLLDDLSHKDGPKSIHRFVEKSSAMLVPYFLDFTADRSFGETFSHEWHVWRDSLMRTTTPLDTSNGTWHIIPGGNRVISTVRWWDDRTIAFTWDNGRSTPALYTTTLDGHLTRLGQRNSLDMNVKRRDGTIIFAQLEYQDRFHVRSDLYASKNGAVRQLTFGKRLSAPDVRADGQIVAVQTLPGVTQLVLVSPDGRHIKPLAVGSSDVQWATPRWSPSGTHIAAARLSHGIAQIIVLDTTGTMLYAFGRASAVVRSPAWMPDGSGLFYTSDQTGVSSIYYARLGAHPTAFPVATLGSAGVYGLDVLNPSRPTPATASTPTLVTTFQNLDGFHIITWRPPAGLLSRGGVSVSDSVKLRKDLTTSPKTATVQAPYDTLRARRYSPWRSLLPTYWTPAFDNSLGHGTLIGALTSGSDVVGRHSYEAEALVNTATHNLNASFSYRYGRLLNPYFDLGAQQSWSYSSIVSGSSVVGELAKRTQLYSLLSTFTRVRSRSNSSVTLGTELENYKYSASPDTLSPHLPSVYQHPHTYPTLLAGFQYTNALIPPLSLSAEDGVVFSTTLRQQWQNGTSGASTFNGVFAASAYKSLDFPGYAHQVLALRVAGGYADDRTPTLYSAGGVGGGSLEIIPGIYIGDQARTFPVRGFPPSAEEGTRAMAASLEYRIPLAHPSSGIGLFPVFFDRAGLSFFTDAGRAFCAGQGAEVCAPYYFNAPTLASVGAELNMMTALQYDIAYQFRFGIAKPVRGEDLYANRSLTLYMTLGATF